MDAVHLVHYIQILLCHCHMLHNLSPQLSNRFEIILGARFISELTWTKSVVPDIHLPSPQILIMSLQPFCSSVRVT